MKRGYAPKQRYKVRFICVFRREAYQLLCETPLGIASDEAGLKRENRCLPVVSSIIVGEQLYEKGQDLNPRPFWHVYGCCRVQRTA